MRITFSAMCDCQKIINDPGKSVLEEDAARLAIAAWYAGTAVDHHILAVLRNYARKQAMQNRWGR